jgi:PEGA domain
MRGALYLGSTLVLLCLFSAAQSASSQTSSAAANKQATAAAEPAPVPTDVTSAKGFVLEDATPVKLRFNRTVSSADAHVGDTVDFEVMQDLSLNGTLVIPKGGLAFGTVTEAQPKRRMARGGKLEINIDYVKLLNSEHAALRAVKGGSGGGHTGAMTAGIVATGIVFFPAAPFFLFMHGKDITMPKGAEFTAYINGDMKLGIAKFQPAPPVAAPEVAATSNSATNASVSFAKLQVESSPPGADIEVDGNFSGNTPSELQIPDGEHTITIKKTGFQDWDRKVNLTKGSNVHLSAELEKTPAQ